MNERVEAKISLTEVEAEILRQCMQATSLTAVDIFRIAVAEFAASRGLRAEVATGLRPYRSWKIVHAKAKAKWETKLRRIG